MNRIWRVSALRIFVAGSLLSNCVSLQGMWPFSSGGGEEAAGLDKCAALVTQLESCLKPLMGQASVIEGDLERQRKLAETLKAEIAKSERTIASKKAELEGDRGLRKSTETLKSELRTLQTELPDRIAELNTLLDKLRPYGSQAATLRPIIEKARDNAQTALPEIENLLHPERQQSQTWWQWIRNFGGRQQPTRASEEEE